MTPPRPSRRRLLGGGAVVLALAAARGTWGAATALAQDPPPNPSDEDLAAGSSAVTRARTDVAGLEAELGEATAAVDAAQAEQGRRLAAVTTAETERDAALALASAAQEQAAATREAQLVADRLTTQAHRELDRFVAASYRQGSIAGSASGFAGVGDAREVLDRAELLSALGADREKAVAGLGRATVAKANADAVARAALGRARVRAAEAVTATKAARGAYGAAVASLNETTARSDELLRTQTRARTQLDAARAALQTLDGQRRTYQDYLAARAAEQARAERAAAERAAEERRRAELAAAAAAEQARAISVGPTEAGSSAPELRRPSTPVVQVAAVRPSPRPSPSGTVAPATGWLSSGFGPRGGTIHYGQDIANDIGTPIVSVQAGTVISAGPASGFGLWVRVAHDDGTITVYGHNDFNVVSVGARVGSGEQVAVIGNRGESTGPHVHFEVELGGAGKVDPLRWLRSRGVDL